MFGNLLKRFSPLLASSIMVLSLSPQIAAAQSHVVKPGELHQTLVEDSAARSENLARIERFLSSENGRRVVAAMPLNRARVERALPLLDDDDLARLASQADKIQADFAGGALNNQQLTYIIIALATAVFILIILVAAD